MKKKLYPLLFVSVLTLTGCTSFGPSPSPEPEPVVDPLVFNDKTMTVYGTGGAISPNNPEEGETYTYSFEGDSIRIENNKVIAVRGASETTVNVTSSSGRTGSFKVTVRSRAYESTHEAAETNEGWFNDVSISKINTMTEDYANGIDISSLKQLYDNGQKFYNKDGVETSLLYILKDAGVNWIRLRLWNEPYEMNGTEKYEYGGGNCSKENMAWIAHEAKAAGLKVLLSFHYSDYWADPSNQVVPKAWVNLTTVADIANAISTFTTETLQYFKDQNATPDAVAIGNETSSGILIHNPGGATTSPTGNGPKYHTEHTERDNSLGGRYTWAYNKQANANFITYIKAGVDAVKAFDSNILTAVHFVRGLGDPQNSITFFRNLEDLDIDIYGLSAYVYYHYNADSKNTLRNGLTTIANYFPNKKIAIMENSYGFTYETDTYASNSFYNGAGSGKCGPVSAYSVNIQGQANMIKDACEVVSSLSNGFGSFYWEGAWTPTKKSGWADLGSKVTWANQGLFSYNGKALGSLEVYRKMLGK